MFAATLHDPEGRFLNLLAEVGCHLHQYASVDIAATATTDNRTCSALQELGARVELIPTGAIGDARRSALRNATGRSPAPIFMCDFDRWLHWVAHYAEELTSLSTRLSALRPAPWYVCLGRTERAFSTHPRVQQVAEAATNTALELAVGYPIDAVAGACWLFRDGAAIVLAESTEKSAATDLEWPALIQRKDPNRLAYIAVEGLEFETASFYPAEVVEAGSRDAWIERVYERPEIWAQRLRLASDSVDALVRTVGTPPGTSLSDKRAP